MFIVAVDVGYSNLKVLWGEAGQPPSSRMLPAGAGPASAMPEQLARGRAAHHLAVLVAGQRWVAGVEPSRLQNWERELHPDYPTTEAYRALLHAALAVAGRDRVDRLVTGLPVSQYQDGARREQLREMLTGAHQITAERQVTVGEVDILPQPFGAYLEMVETADDAEAFAQARTLVIDPGFFSCDWVLIDGGELRTTNSGSSASAMSLVLEGADDLIQQEHGGRPGRDELEKLLRNGAERTQLFGTPIALPPFIAAAARQTTSVAITAVKQSLRSERRQVDVVLLTGGGAGVYADAIHEAFPKARIVVPDAAVLANVRGFWRYAVQADEAAGPQDPPPSPPRQAATAEPVTAEPVTAEPMMAEPMMAEPVMAEPVMAEPVMAEPALADDALADDGAEDRDMAEPVAMAAEPLVPAKARRVAQAPAVASRPVRGKGRVK